jgi:uncharacterized coiled-coil protein SlyX
VGRTPTSAILTTIRGVEELKDVVTRHQQALDRLADRVLAIETRLRALEDKSPEPGAGG